MDEHKAQVRPSLHSSMDMDPSPLHATREMHAMMSHDSEDASHALLPLNGAEPFSFIDAPSVGDALMPSAHDALSLHSNGMMSMHVPSLSHEVEGEEEGEEDSLNEVDDAPRATYIDLDSDEDIQPPSALPPSPPQQMQTKQSARQAAAHAAAIAAAAVDEALAGGESDTNDDDNATYCYCDTKWTGEMMVSCDQCLQWFHAGQSRTSLMPPVTIRFFFRPCADLFLFFLFPCCSCVFRLHGHSRR